MQTPDFLVIGHLCHDWSPDGNLLGGTAAYAALFAKKMGLSTSILTSFGKDFEFATTFRNIDLQYFPSEKTTYFKNEYQGSARQQFLLEKSNNIFTNQLPETWRSSKMVLLGPIANEIDLDFLNIFPDALLAICPQGWMRRWNSEGKVFHEMPNDWTIFAKADIVILSEEDLNFQLDLIPHLASLFEILVVTKAEQGAEVYFNNNKHTFVGFPTEVIDPTGAGDIFTTAFLIRYAETKDVAQAANFANSAASYAVGSKGIKGLVSKEKILKRC